MANKVTCFRIVCALALIFCPAFSKWFFLFYIPGGASDVLDGILARKLSEESEAGARLDTIADIVFTSVVLVKVLRAVLYIPLWLIVWIIVIAAIKCVSLISGLRLYGHIVSEHTVLNRICGVLLFIIPLCIGKMSWQIVLGLAVLTCFAATAAALSEGRIVLLRGMHETAE